MRIEIPTLTVAEIRRLNGSRTAAILCDQEEYIVRFARAVEAEIARRWVAALQLELEQEDHTDYDHTDYCSPARDR